MIQLTFLKQIILLSGLSAITENWGFAKGYNEALKQVDADYYVMLNSDVEVTPGWLEPMINLLENDKSIAACQPKILSYHNKKMFEYAGAAGGWIDKYGYPFSKGRVFDICEEDHGQYDQSEPIFWASGAALFIRSSVFHEMKGFDEYFFAHQEEIDLCWRIQLAGYKIYSCPASIVYHVGGGTLPKRQFKERPISISATTMIMLAKNLPLSKKIWIIPVRIFLDADSCMERIADRRWWLFYCDCKGTFGVCKMVYFLSKKKLYSRLHEKGNLHGYLSKEYSLAAFCKKEKNLFRNCG